MQSSVKKKSKVCLPGYYARVPILKSVREIRQYGGFQDASVQLSEISLLHLIEHASKAPEGVRKYVSEYARKHKMHLGLDNFDNYRHALTEVYVVETYQVAERFFKSLNAEYRCIKKVDKEKWIKKDKDGKNLSPLQQFASNLPKKNRGFVESAPESLLIDYYRLVRNWIIHRDDKTRKTALHCYDEVLRKHKDHISNCYAGLAAPSLPDELSFDDYYLFTRALKYFANLLNNAADVTLEDVAGYLAGDNVIVRELRKNAHNQSARQRYLSGKCKECFGIVSSADIDYILASTDKLLGITK